MYVLRYSYDAKSDIEWNPFFSKRWGAVFIVVGQGEHIKALFGCDCLWLVPGTHDPEAA